MSKKYQQAILLFTTLGLYIFFLQFNETVDFENCQLCDAKEYKKLYDYFETGEISQIGYPFYTRPVVPFLASLVPGDNVTIAFHVINLIFILLSVLVINKLWDLLTIQPWLKWIGFGWLLTHWTGIIRYNLFDHLTVDVPLYFVQSLALLLFFKKEFKWFYLLTPLAILQKESFIGVVVVLLGVHIFEQRSLWFKEGRHLLYALSFGIFIQIAILKILPNQDHEWHPLLTLLLVAKMTLDDPTRIIRWFAAFGSAFGVIPFLIAFKAKSIKRQDTKVLTLLALSVMYCAFGLLAGEDMTRILFLGFPFIMTLSLLFFQNESKWVMVSALLLSAVSLHFYPFPIDNKWGVDYAPIEFVYQWAMYYFATFIIFFTSFMFFRKKTTSANS